MTIRVINTVTEFDRDLLIERTHAGINRTKAEGKTFGRPSALTANQKTEVIQHLGKGIPIAQLAKALKISRQTIMRGNQEAFKSPPEHLESL